MELIYTFQHIVYNGEFPSSPYSSSFVSPENGFKINKMEQYVEYTEEEDWILHTIIKD